MLKSQQKRGLDIQYCRDLKSYKKLIPALSKYPESVIVTADDDGIYPENWLEKLVSSYNEDPDSVHCWMARELAVSRNGGIKNYRKWRYIREQIQASKLVVPIGVGGVLYPPHVLHDEVLNESVFMKIAPGADDLWFKVMATLANTKTRKIDDNRKPVELMIHIRDIYNQSLWSSNSRKDGNDVQFKAIVKKYKPDFF